MKHEYYPDPVELKVGDIVVGLNHGGLEGKEFIVVENEDEEEDYPFRAVCLDEDDFNFTITLFGWIHSDYKSNPKKPRLVPKRPILLKTNLDDFFKVI